MTLDEAIARFEMGIKQIEKELFIRSEYGNQTNDMFRRIIAERYEEHRKNQVEETKQLVEMLRELKIFRERGKTITIKTLTSKPCEDAISRQAAIDALKQAYWNKDMQNAKDDPCIVDAMTDWAIRTIKDLPSVKPQYTEDEIQKMQDLEQAEIQKAYELGKTEGQNSEDVISRQAVLGLFAQNADAVRPYSKTWEEVKALPPVNPQPKVGHWILYDHGLGAKSYQCSVCKGFDRGEKGKYCKWCGTKMVEPQ